MKTRTAREESEMSGFEDDAPRERRQRMTVERIVGAVAGWFEPPLTGAERARVRRGGR